VSAISEWGSTATERAAPLPCDDLLPGAPCRYHRAVSVQAPAAVAYRRLCQLTVAPYSYDLIDNRGRRSPRELTPGADRLTEGQRIMVIFRLASHAPDDHLTLVSARTAVTYAVRPAATAANGVRLVVRLLFAPPGGRLAAPVLGAGLGLGDLVMMRRQLLNLKALAERDAAVGPPRSPLTSIASDR
jgi:hypothetical protein